MTNTKILRRLLWKDFRLQRMFWICMGALGILLQFLGILVREASPVDQLVWLFGVSMVIPAFYALGCGATMFAGERETGTYDFQRGMPVTAKQFFWSNVLFGALSTAAMIAVLFAAALCFAVFSLWLASGSFPELPERFWELFFFGLWGIGILELFVWGTLFSLILKRPLVAAMLGVAAASAGIQLVIPGVSSRGYYNPSPYLDARAARLAIVAAVAIIDIFLGCRWFRGEGFFTEFCERWRLYKKTSTLPAAALPAVATKRFGFFPAFVRLAWQQARMSVWLWSGYFLVLMFAILGMPFIEHRLQGWETALGIFFTVVVACLPLLGVYVFYPDQQRRSFLFLTERGVRPSYFWWSRQLAGLAVPLLLGIIFYVCVLIPSNAHNNFAFIPLWELVQLKQRNISPTSYLYFVQFLVFFYHLLVVYSAGQLCAMFIRSGIVAGFCSWGLMLGILAWTWLMFFWCVPWWWSIAPWPFLLLLLTWLRTPTWLLERRDFHSALRRAAVLLPAIAIVLAVPFYRVFSVPEVDPGFSPDEFARSLKPTPAALETATMYKKAYELVEKNKKPEQPLKVEPWMVGEPSEKPPEAWKPFEPPAPRDIEVANANLPAIELTLKASKLTECDFYEGYPFMENSSAGLDAGYLGHLLLWRAMQLESEGQLDAAWEHYLGALRVVRHLNYHAPSGQWYHNLLRDVCSNLSGWAARPGQTPERIRAAIEQIRDFPLSTNQLACVSKYEYIYDRGILTGDKKFTEREEAANSSQFLKKAKEREFDSLKFWERAVPWERYRALRLLNIITREQLRRIETLSNRLEKDEAVAVGFRDWSFEPPFALWNEVILPPRINLWKESHHWIFDAYTINVAKSRAVQIMLALEAWKLEHGKFPDSLDSLVGKYFEKLPVDPISGRPFRYFPEGLPTRLNNIAPWEIYRNVNDAPIYLEAKQPFLWSVGDRVIDRGFEGATVARYAIFRGRFRNDYLEVNSEEDIWRNGLIFPLP